MIIAPSTNPGARLDMELCRAMFEKDPDRLLELVSDWLEVNRLTPSDDFQVPTYLEVVLARAESAKEPSRRLRVLVS
ncbi:hypothetical protein [Roseibium sediminicola]|uniref:Uncharacterized protein n=1 Tax=Roseibium sediminicola TaxID=2933272 RepID=A0ABT0H2F7_9HYPH|nr:hypothetical protein [Roseibium sp. CAU 1639]MCK7615280.1 hypothetical protein [Roseibium sp. CAU 1639]